MHLMPDPHTLRPAPTAGATGTHAPALVEASRKFEAAILTDLLRAAGGAPTGSQFGGGIGEDQFASLLLEAQAQSIAAAGGIGLAEMVLRGLLAQADPAQATP